MNISSKIARNLSFRHLRAFVCVAETGSFTRAAEKLAVSQPALTSNIRQFEEIVGVELLTRTTRYVELNACGREFLPQVKQFISNFDSAIIGIRTKAQQLESADLQEVFPANVQNLM